MNMHSVPISAYRGRLLSVQALWYGVFVVPIHLLHTQYILFDFECGSYVIFAFVSSFLLYVDVLLSYYAILRFVYECV